ncbi:diiron oxygenase [Carbonactinospora thermoautotrophica]|uniref:Membrane protein n=1 Tax=Carbonactinospora thermoautotrophica TaxID=1469144 RepID=A0A132N5P5_9ACTN|nr:diiron oxygenase [Carbonactinospora thermoautotrophica]KWX05468.1 membrane protein [Carbonactinospora thermoautotrophica]KWX08862.1 membrane protein [Carbonactinospora thermoautotrophica]MCX9193752.1 diiron oxygenase [Carbonactinospora thermoautotrophica]
MGHGVTDREHVADRLLKASAAHSFDPLVEIDWEAPLLEGVFFLPEHRVSLYGTELWERMSHQQRVDLSRHEVASMASVGIWFELILMQMLVRHVYHLDPTSRHVQYALTEIGDECRHSVMFGRLVEKLGCPAYGPDRHAHLLGRFLKATATGPAMFAAILIAEEILDTLQRETMADENVQPLVRAVSRIHVIEESRHVRYAREELLRQVTRISRPELAVHRLLTARSAHVITTRLIHPGVYAAVGLDPREARAAARANPHHRDTLRWAARRIVRFLDETGLLGGPGVVLWRRAALI